MNMVSLHIIGIEVDARRARIGLNSWVQTGYKKEIKIIQKYSIIAGFFSHELI